MKGDGEGDESDYSEWKLFNLTSAEIFKLWKLITSQVMKTLGFHTGLHKTIFPRWVTLSNTAFALLIEGAILNDTLFRLWLLDFNSEGKTLTRPERQGRGNAVRSLRGCVYKWHDYILKGRETLDPKERLTKLIKGSIVLPKTNATSVTSKLTKKTTVMKPTSTTNKMPKTRRANAMIPIPLPTLVSVPSPQRS